MLTRKKLRQLIQEAIDRIPLFSPVSRDELDQIRDQSRQRAGIPDTAREKIRSLETSKNLAGEPSEEDINQARFLAKSLGSDQGEISAMEEDNFLRAQAMHEILPIFEPIFGQAIYNLDPKLLKKVYESTQAQGPYEVWIFDMLQEIDSLNVEDQTREVILEQLKRGDYIIYSFGQARQGPAHTMLTHQDFTNLQNRIKRNLPLPPDYYIFKMLVSLRPDIDIWSAN
mgnify:CR=1 FL=1